MAGSRDHILAIDCGTQSVRALLFDLDGNLVGKARVPFPPHDAPQPGWAEQSADTFWTALCQACQELWHQTSVAKTDVAGVALTTQRGTVINVDQDGRPLRPAIVWPDQRRTSGQQPVAGRWGVAFRLTGLRETIAYIQAEAELNWIRTYQPEVWSSTHKLLLLSGYLTYRLTGRFVDSVACQVAYLPFDYKHQRWAAPGSWHWQAMPMTPGLLPELMPPAGRLGEITSAAAAATGIPAGLPLIAAAADKACEVLGAGCHSPATGCLSYGTAATINAMHPRYVEPIRFLPPYPAAVPGAYCAEIQVIQGYGMVSWFKDEFGHHEQRLAAERGVEPETLFEAQVERIPPGADGLLLQPYWSPGVMIPGPEARGSIIGFRAGHTRAHVYRAILEGVAYALREGKDRLERRGRVPMTELRVVGGGSQSDVALQLTADIFGLPAARPHVYEASGLGAAIVAAVGLGLHPDFATAIHAMTRTSRVFTPDPERCMVYDQLYERVYRRLYPRLKGLYEEIGTIVGRDAQ